MNDKVVTYTMFADLWWTWHCERCGVEEKSADLILAMRAHTKHVDNAHAVDPADVPRKGQVRFDFAAVCSACGTPRPGKLVLDESKRVVHAKGGLVLGDGWMCTECLEKVGSAGSAG